MCYLRIASSKEDEGAKGWGSRLLCWVARAESSPHQAKSVFMGPALGWEPLLRARIHARSILSRKQTPPSIFEPTPPDPSARWTHFQGHLTNRSRRVEIWHHHRSCKIGKKEHALARSSLTDARISLEKAAAESSIQGEHRLQSGPVQGSGLPCHDRWVHEAPPPENEGADSFRRRLRRSQRCCSVK